MNWYETRSLPVNEEIVSILLSCPGITCDDLEALSASVANCPEMGMSSKWINIISDTESKIVLQNYSKSVMCINQ